MFQEVIDGDLAAGLETAEVRRRIVELTGVELSREYVRQRRAARGLRPDSIPDVDLAIFEHEGACRRAAARPIDSVTLTRATPPSLRGQLKLSPDCVLLESTY